MSEQEAQAPADVETPANEATVEGGEPTAEATPAEVDWQERYSNLQPEYTRATQEAAELRKERELYQQMVTDEDPQRRREAAEALGYTLDEPEPEPTERPDFVPYDEWEAFQAQQAEREQEHERAQAMEQIETYVDEQLDSIEGLTEKQKDWITSRALSLPATQGPNGLKVPDIAAAHKEFQDELMSELASNESLRKQVLKDWQKTKQPQHHVAANGGEGELIPPRLTHEQRVERAMSRLNGTT